MPARSCAAPGIALPFGAIDLRPEPVHEHAVDHGVLPPRRWTLACGRAGPRGLEALPIALAIEREMHRRDGCRDRRDVESVLVFLESLRGFDLGPRRRVFAEREAKERGLGGREGQSTADEDPKAATCELFD